MHDYWRVPFALRGALLRTAFVAAWLLSGCSEPPPETTDSAPRPKLIVSGQLDDPDIDEASGLARSQRDPERLWVINDGGSKPRIHAIDFNGTKTGRIDVENARNRDWEDIASFSIDGSPYLLVADIGDNDARRGHVTLYVVPEPDLEHGAKVDVEPAWQVDFEYPDGPRDAEAVAVDAEAGLVYVLTKRDLPPVLYSVPLRPDPGGRISATRIAALRTLHAPARRDVEQAMFTKDWHWQPTAMDLSGDGRLVVVLTYRAVYVYRRTAGDSLVQALSRRPHAMGLGHFREAEAVTFADGGATIFITVERRHAPLLRIELNGAIPE